VPVPRQTSRSRARGVAAARLGWALAVGLALLAGCTGHGDRPQPSAATAGPAAAGCDGAVQRAPLPTWARAGFTPPDQPTIYVQGARGDIVGVLFGWPLRAPPVEDRQNKILWVARKSAGGAPLRIAARLAGSGVVVEREVQGGPGPSIVNLPAAGCWRFDLTWSGHADQVNVPYQPAAGGVAGEGTGG
jgi:hypothetical protein